MPDIMHVVKIHASPEQVYEALTTDEGIRNWWTRDAVLDSAIGGVGEFGFFNRRVVTKVKIDELKPPIRVAWTTISSAAPGGGMIRGLRSICDRRLGIRCSASRIAALNKPTKAMRERRRVGDTIS